MYDALLEKPLVCHHDWSRWEREPPAKLRYRRVTPYGSPWMLWNLRPCGKLGRFRP